MKRIVPGAGARVALRSAVLAFSAALALTAALTLQGCQEQKAGQQSAGGAPAATGGGTAASAHPAGGTPHEAGQNAASFSGPTRSESAAGISYQVPTTWQSSPPSSNMRAAQYTLPAGKPGGEAPELVLYFFGEGSGGSAEANIDRWIGQMAPPEGKTAGEPQRESRQIGAFKVSLVRVNGTYASSMMPGMAAGASMTGYRLWGAVVEGQGGPWFFKAAGPQAGIEAAEPALDAMLASVKSAK